MKLLKRLQFVFRYGPELDQLVEKQRQENIAKKREEDKHRLKLCFKHRQEPNRSHYAEHNCDHCAALARIDFLDKHRYGPAART